MKSRRLRSTKLGSVASTKFNRFQLIKSKCYKINSIENQHFSYLSDSIFHKEKQQNSQMRQNLEYPLLESLIFVRPRVQLCELNP